MGHHSYQYFLLTNTLFQAYGEVIWFRGRVSGIIFLAFVLMVMSSVAAAWADISRLEFLNNLPYPHLSDANINGGSIDPNTGKWIPAESPMKAEQDRINQQLEDAGITDSDSLFESTSGIGSIFVANSGYSWMALNCFATAGYVSFLFWLCAQRPDLTLPLLAFADAQAPKDARIQGLGCDVLQQPDSHTALPDSVNGEGYTQKPASMFTHILSSFWRIGVVRIWTDACESRKATRCRPALLTLLELV